MRSLHRWQDLLNVRLPIVQAPMAGVSSPAMAAAATGAGALGSIAVGAGDASTANASIAAVRARSDGPFNVNLFCHHAPTHDPFREAVWIERFRATFADFSAEPPPKLREIYRSFVDDDAMLALLLEARPAVVSFHFGLPRASAIRALKEAGICLFASATSLAEARAVQAAGIDVIIAQGPEAGGHRGIFEPAGPDQQLPVLALTQQIARSLDTPVVAAGGLMDGADIARALSAGAVAAQLGTAFIACDESLADAGYRAALTTAAQTGTEMTTVISGRPARCLTNRFTQLGREIPARDTPNYPIAYDLGKALHRAAEVQGEYSFGAHWAGIGAPRMRAMSTAKLIETLAFELNVALAGTKAVRG
jgi:nitronate monooxygenase